MNNIKPLLSAGVAVLTVGLAGSALAADASGCYGAYEPAARQQRTAARRAGWCNAGKARERNPGSRELKPCRSR